MALQEQNRNFEPFQRFLIASGQLELVDSRLPAKRQREAQRAKAFGSDFPFIEITRNLLARLCKLNMKLKEAFVAMKVVTYPAAGPLVCKTVAEAVQNSLATGAAIQAYDDPAEVKSEPACSITCAENSEQEERWMSLRMESSGKGELVASHPHLLYTLYCLVNEEWVAEDIEVFNNGRKVTPSFSWQRSYSDFLVGSLRTARGFDPEQYIRQLAREGFSHVAVNGLGVEGPFESGPPGDVYSWFYDYSPDLDQFVESNLIKGFYPREYLDSNLKYLNSNARFAIKYGLTPGLHCNSPRSMPDAFWAKYPFLRGARIDHPRESFRPRYTLAMAHPVVQQHYRELIRNLLRELPELGFMHIWTNDSGAGFEFVNSLYAGRNGGPYLIREWKNEEEIAKKAGENVLTYFHLLRDEGRKFNPRFRLVVDLGPFTVEKKYIIQGMGNGIDAGSFGNFELPEYREEQQQLQSVGSRIHRKIDLVNNNVLGIPFPKLVYDILRESATQGCRWVLTQTTPEALAPYDINSEVLRAFQCSPQVSVDDILTRTAQRWVGIAHALALQEIWLDSDTAVRSFPPGIPYSTFAFPWFRLWVRPFVPNIDAIPESERRYYEDYLIATFNNPTRIDLNNDMLWNFLTVSEAADKREQIDASVLPLLDRAITKCESVLESFEPAEQAKLVFIDLHDRLIAASCFYTTMRNTVAWIVSVHGYLEAPSPAVKEEFHRKVREMMASELQNANDLLRLWETSPIHFIPVSSRQESLHMYGENFGELLKKKIQLMQRHENDEPYIDPNYMWRMQKNLDPS